MLEALLARVQKRAQEPRPGNIHIPPLPVPEVGEAAQDSADTLPPQAAAAHVAAQPSAQLPSVQAPSLQPPSSRSPELQLAEVDDEDIEEYDEELIEIIDDADVIPQAAAAARAIEPSAFGANLERRGAAPNGKSSAPAAAAPAGPVHAAPPALSSDAPPRAAMAPAAAAEPLRPEAVSARPVAPSPVVHTRGVRRDLRATPFLELLDAALKLGS
jgi:hypothetical protein